MREENVLILINLLERIAEALEKIARKSPPSPSSGK